MWFLPLLTLLVFPLTQAHLLGMCFTHHIAFPNGRENADTTQTLCNLLQENMAHDFSCDGLTTMTASEFQETYEASHAEFCAENAVLVASVVTGTHPEAQQVYETALAETLAYLQAGSEENATERRKLSFVDALGGAIEDLWNFSPVLTIMIGMVLLTGLVVGGAAGLIWLGLAGRRALTAPTGASAVAFSANDILSECASGIDSFLCEVPVSELLQVFSTGVCASVAGLLCVVSSDDLLALASN